MVEKEETRSTESLTVEEAKQEYLAGELSRKNASTVEATGSGGFDVTFLCSNGYLIVNEELVEAQTEE